MANMRVPDCFVFPVSVAISSLAIVAGCFVVDTTWAAMVVGTVATWVPTFFIATIYAE